MDNHGHTFLMRWLLFPLTRWRSVAMGAVIMTGVLAPLARYWLAGLTLIHRDQTGQYAPLRWLAGHALREGRLPLWNPFCATGMPYLAETTHGVLHPLSVAVAFLFPGDGLDPLIGAYILAAGLGAGVFARTLGASRPASVLAAFAYGLSGYALSMTSNMVNLAGTGSVPWILAGLRITSRDRTPAAFVWGALSVAAGALSGDIQELVVATLCGLVLAFEAGGKRGIALAGLASVIGALLAGIQLAPSWSFLHMTNRALPLPYFDLRQWDFDPWRFIEFISPGFFWIPEDGYLVAPVFRALGHPMLFNVPFAESVFLGAATGILVVGGLRSGRPARVLALSACVVLWTAMGSYLGARAVQNMFPIVSGFRYGEKFLPTFLACLSVLAALGADRLTSGAGTARRFMVAAGVMSLILAAFWLYLASGRGLPSGLQEGEAVRSHLTSGLPHAFLSSGALAVCLWFGARGKRKVALLGMATVIWYAAIAAAPYALRPGHPEARIAVAPPPLSAASTGPRVMNVTGPRQRMPFQGWNSIDQLNFDVESSLGANTNAWHRIDNLAVDTGLYPLRWYRLYGALGRQVARAAHLYAVTHIIFPPPHTDEGRSLAVLFTRGGAFLGIDPRNGMHIWAVPHRDWAAFPPALIVVSGPDRASEEVLQTIETGRDVAVVETDGPVFSAPGRVLSLSRGLESVEVVAEAAGASTLVVNDAFWPGWRAEIDGEETPIIPADLLVRAVRWPAGRHTLVMRYDPPEIRTGKWLSFAGLIGLVGISSALRRRSRPGKLPGGMDVKVD